MFSKSCEYGLKATIYIAEQSNLKKKVGLKSIAAAIDSPEAFTAKILQILAKNHIITSIKGSYGGFIIEEPRLKELVTNQSISLKSDLATISNPSNTFIPLLIVVSMTERILAKF